MNSSEKHANGRKISPVFIYSAIIVAIVVLIGAILPEQFDTITNNIKLWITEKLGWYYLILTTFIVFFCIFLRAYLQGYRHPSSSSESSSHHSGVSHSQSESHIPDPGTSHKKWPFTCET